MSYSKIKTIRISKYDDLWSQLARKRIPHCEVCGKREFLAAHHYVRRSVKPTRLFLPNAVILCPSHHTFSHIFSAHKTPEAFKRWFKQTHRQRAKQIEEKERTHMTERDAIKEFIATHEQEITD